MRMAGHNIPPPPGAPLNIPPPPSALPTQAGGGSQQQQQQAPHGVQTQGPLGNVQQPGGPGFQNGGQLQGGGQSSKGQGNLQQKLNQKTIYKYFQARKPTSRDLETGIKPSWALATFSEVSIPSAEIEEKVRTIRALANKPTRKLSVERSAIDEYNELPAASMRDQVDELLRKHMREERDPAMEWSIAAIETEKRALSRVATEVSCMRVYIKRSLRAEYAGNNNKSGGSQQHQQQQGSGFMGGQGGAFNGQRPMQNALPGQQQQPGGHIGGMSGAGSGIQFPAPGGFPGVGPGMPGPLPGVAMPGMPGAGINLPPGGQFPGVKVMQVNKGGIKDKKENKGSKSNDRNRDGRRGKGKAKKKSKNGYSSSDSDEDDHSDSSSDSSGAATDRTDGERNGRKLEDAMEEIEDLREQFQRLVRRTSSSATKARRVSSPSRLPRVPMGLYRPPSREYLPQRKQSWERNDRHYVPRLTTSMEPNPRKVAMVERIHYHNSDDSDGRDGMTDGSGPSITSWIGGQSAFSRPPSDAYTPPESPRRSQEFHFGNPAYAYREHHKPARNPYPSPPASPKYIDDRYHHDRGYGRRDGRDGRDYRRAPELDRRNTYPAIGQGAGDYFGKDYDYHTSRNRSPHYDPVRRNTNDAVDHMVARQRAERESGRRGERKREKERQRQKDRYRRAEEERYYDDDRYGRAGY